MYLYGDTVAVLLTRGSWGTSGLRSRHLRGTVDDKQSIKMCLQSQDMDSLHNITLVVKNNQSSTVHRTKLITVQMIFLHLTVQLKPLNPRTKQRIHTNKLHHYLSLLLSHSSCASRRILSSSPCRAEEMLSCGPDRLSLRLTAAISSSSSTQEPDEETIQAAEFVTMPRQETRMQTIVWLHIQYILSCCEPERSRDEESKHIEYLPSQTKVTLFDWVVFQYYCLSV